MYAYKAREKTFQKFNKNKEAMKKTFNLYGNKHHRYLSYI